MLFAAKIYNCGNMQGRKVYRFTDYHCNEYLKVYNRIKSYEHSPYPAL